MFCLFLGAFAVAASAAPLQFQSSERQGALVELYTSEGCSSCPPAEAWLSGLTESRGLWSDFVPVAFHVDYWDSLGWRDKWASKEYSDRQREYARLWGSQGIYTPGFVLNGKEWRKWSVHEGGPPASNTKAGLLNLRSDDGIHWQVSFLPGLSGASGYEVNAALLLSGFNSEVKAGENAGRSLKHDFVALTLAKEPLSAQNNVFRGTFTVNSPQKTAGGRPALAVWVTRVGRLEPIQAVGGWLPKPAEK